MLRSSEPPPASGDGQLGHNVPGFREGVETFAEALASFALLPLFSISRQFVQASNQECSALLTRLFDGLQIPVIYTGHERAIFGEDYPNPA
ncbi:MAG: hypothetical protein ACLQVD_12070 [Capsulimonadaceae bacterium]